MTGVMGMIGRRKLAALALTGALALSGVLALTGWVSGAGGVVHVARVQADGTATAGTTVPVRVPSNEVPLQ
jgi:hypothetical protein